MDVVGERIMAMKNYMQHKLMGFWKSMIKEFWEKMMTEFAKIMESRPLGSKEKHNWVLNGREEGNIVVLWQNRPNGVEYTHINILWSSGNIWWVNVSLENLSMEGATIHWFNWCIGWFKSKEYETITHWNMQCSSFF